MEVYAVMITIAAVIFAVSALKWKISMQALVWFCKEKFREPTDKKLPTTQKKQSVRCLTDVKLSSY